MLPNKTAKKAGEMLLVLFPSHFKRRKSSSFISKCDSCYPSRSCHFCPSAIWMTTSSSSSLSSSSSFQPHCYQGGFWTNASDHRHNINNERSSEVTRIPVQRTIAKTPFLRLIRASLGPSWASRATLQVLTLCCLLTLGVGLQCYTDIEAKKVVTCNELEGFKSCFTKFNDSKPIPSVFPFGVLYNYHYQAAVIGRGCSTKDKVYYHDCDTHSYGNSLEKMCFCSFKLCNNANGGRNLVLFTARFSDWSKIPNLLLILIIGHSVSTYLCSSLNNHANNSLMVSLHQTLPPANRSNSSHCRSSRGGVSVVVVELNPKSRRSQQQDLPSPGKGLQLPDLIPEGDPAAHRQQPPPPPSPLGLVTPGKASHSCRS